MQSLPEGNCGQAQFTVQGVMDKNCLALAQLHSDAVDFPKTGKVVEIPAELRPASFPDFMQNKLKRSYQSKKVIGRLYRQIQVSMRLLSLTAEHVYSGRVLPYQLYQPLLPGWCYDIHYPFRCQLTLLGICPSQAQYCHLQSHTARPR